MIESFSSPLPAVQVSHQQGQVIVLKNAHGLAARFSTYGARWLDMWVPDRNGCLEDVLLGFSHLSAYESASEQYYGAIVGRVCGRIKNAGFRIGERYYRLAANERNGDSVCNHLHGGVLAFHNCHWEGTMQSNEKGEEAVVFTRMFEDGEEGYPGNLHVSVTYTLTRDNSIEMICKARTDQMTPVNVTNHAFFNLAGVGKKVDILSHSLRIRSSQIIACDEHLLPTGHLIPVTGTVLNFEKPRKIADAFTTDYANIRHQNGFSLAYALDHEGDCSLAAELYDTESGRKLSIYTNQPSLQVYTGYLMDGSDVGKGGIPYDANAGIALETQGYPDALHWPCFPSVLLEVDKEYIQYTKYTFSTDRRE